MIGTIKFVNRSRVWGFILGEDGNDYFWHYSDLNGKQSRTRFLKGAKVSFDIDATDGDTREPHAKNVTELEKPTPNPFGKWVSTSVKGQFRCSECRRYTDRKELKFCPFCGADMKGGSNAVQISLMKSGTKAHGRWHSVGNGDYLCNKCGAIYSRAARFCPECGTFMEKFKSQI